MMQPSVEQPCSGVKVAVERRKPYCAAGGVLGLAPEILASSETPAAALLASTAWRTQRSQKGQLMLLLSEQTELGRYKPLLSQRHLLACPQARWKHLQLQAYNYCLKHRSGNLKRLG